MHIPDSMLQGNLCSATAALSAAGLAASTYFCVKAPTRPAPTQFSAVTALIFAGQMLNFPISNGTSGHLLGGVLAATLLGTPFGVMSIAIVVSLQALVFSDGGVAVLGANLLNMALVGAGLGGWLRSHLLREVALPYLATAVAAWASVVVASFLVSVELAFDGQISFGKVLPAMLTTHAVIGVGEAALTVVACALFAPKNIVAVPSRHFSMSATAAVLLALMLSPFASPLPDGLEWVAARYGFWHDSTPAFTGFFANYAVPSLQNTTISTAAAGFCGVLMSFGVAWIVARTFAVFRNAAQTLRSLG